MNEPAFPVPSYVNAQGETHDVEFTGMTLRDYFAARAMPVAIKTLMHDYTRDDEDWFWESYIDNDMLAELSYEMADAMLKARESNKQE
jgi:phosphoketolase